MGDIFTGAPMYADDLARTILQTSRGRSFFFLLSTALVPGLAGVLWMVGAKTLKTSS